MTNIIEVNYHQTGESKKTNSFGMRDMQEKAFNSRNEKYLLLKAPPASGKSRALMFIALDKLYHQGIKKVIVAVPERSIGGSFGLTNLKKDGFFASWEPNPLYNLCIPGGENSKVEAFKKFILNEEKILICTHATLRFAFKELDDTKFNNCLLAIDEFHHVSADGENQLGELREPLIINYQEHFSNLSRNFS